jgi:hypothetical protein
MDWIKPWTARHLAIEYAFQLHSGCERVRLSFVCYGMVKGLRHAAGRI